MILIKIYITFILLFFIFIFLKYKKIEHFNVLGSIDDLCPKFNLIETEVKFKNTKPYNYNYYCKKSGDGLASGNQEEKFYIEEEVQPFYNSNLIGIRQSKNFLWLLDENHDIKYCKSNNTPTQNLYFKYLFPKNYFKDNQLELLMYGPSYDEDKLLILYQDNKKKTNKIYEYFYIYFKNAKLQPIMKFYHETDDASKIFYPKYFDLKTNIKYICCDIYIKDDKFYLLLENEGLIQNNREYKLLVSDIPNKKEETIFNAKYNVGINVFKVSKLKDIYTKFDDCTKISKASQGGNIKNIKNDITNKTILTNNIDFIKDTDIITKIKKNIKSNNIYSDAGIYDYNKLKFISNKFYNFDINVKNKNEKEYGFISINQNEKSKLTHFEKKKLNRFNFLVGKFVQVTNIENENKTADDREKIYSRINKNIIPKLYNILIPGFKFNLLKRNFENDKIFKTYKNSMLQYFLNIEKDNKNEIQNRKDWIYLYNALKNSGIYYPARNTGIEDNIGKINTILKNDLDIIKNDKFKKKHRDLIFNDNFYDIYNYEDDNIYPNIHVYDANGDNLDKEKDVLINFDYKSDSEKTLMREIIPKNRIYIGLDKTIENTKKINSLNRTFFNYKLIYMKYSNYKEEDSLKYKWKMKEISNFKEFKEALFGDHSSSNLEKERLKGLFELSELYIDGEYIEELYKLRTILLEDDDFDLINYDKMLKKKQTIANNNCILKNDKLINILGYPFNIIYKEEDSLTGQPNICNADPNNPDTQKIFLLNNMESKSFVVDGTDTTKSLVIDGKGNPNTINTYQKIYNTNSFNPDSTKQNQIKMENYKLNIKYPFIKQEYISYTGLGNLIQFYSEKMNGFTDISFKGICKNLDDSLINNCEGTKDACIPNKLGYVNIDGSPKCEISDITVSRNKEGDNEQLFIGTVPGNACKIYILLGNGTYYFKLHRIFSEGNSGKFQQGGVFMIEWVDIKNKDNENTFLKKVDDKIKLVPKPEPNVDLDSSYKFYIYEGKVEMKDNYGNFIMFSDSKNSENVLTVKYNKFNPVELDYTIESIQDIKNRNKYDDNYLNNKLFYTQKFLLDDSLLRNLYVNDKMKNDTFKKKVEKYNEMNKLSAKLTPGNKKEIANNLSTDEEIKLSNKLNNRLKTNFNRIKDFEDRLKNGDFNIDTQLLIDKLNKQDREVKNRTVFYQKNINDKKKYKLYSNVMDNQLKIVDKELLKLQNQSNLEYEEDEEINSNINVNKMNNSSEMKKTETRLKNLLDSYKAQKPKCEIEQFTNIYENNKLNNHLVDNYQKYIMKSVNKSKCALDKNVNDINTNLEKIQNISRTVNYNNNNKELKLNEELKKNDDLNRDIYTIKNYEQAVRMNKIKEKMEELQKLKCKLNIKHKKPKNDKYNSIISKEDGELLNVYKLNKCDKKKYKEDLHNLNSNKILINGGCLEYNQKENTLLSKHCMIGNSNQIFNVEKINSREDLRKQNLGNYGAFDKPFYIIKKKKKN